MQQPGSPGPSQHRVSPVVGVAADSTGWVLRYKLAADNAQEQKEWYEALLEAHMIPIRKKQKEEEDRIGAEAAKKKAEEEAARKKREKERRQRARDASAPLEEADYVWWQPAPGTGPEVFSKGYKEVFHRCMVPAQVTPRIPLL